MLLEQFCNNQTGSLSPGIKRAYNARRRDPTKQFGFFSLGNNGKKLNEHRSLTCGNFLVPLKTWIRYRRKTCAVRQCADPPLRNPSSSETACNCKQHNPPWPHKRIASLDTWPHSAGFCGTRLSTGSDFTATARELTHPAPVCQTTHSLQLTVNLRCVNPRFRVQCYVFTRSAKL